MSSEQYRGPPKHTPGPWHIASQDDYDDIAMVVDFSGNAIANVRKQDAVGEANAGLITAAPELLEALAAVLADAKRRKYSLAANITDAAQAAIAKATGVA